MACNCQTTWGSRIFNCSNCWKLDGVSINAIKSVIEKFADDLMKELGPPKGSVNKETFWSRQPTPPGTSIPRFKIVSRYCTSNDWFRVRNFNLKSELDGKDIGEAEKPQDCTPLQLCDKPPHWLGYWWVKNATCDCISDPPQSQSGALVGQATSLGESLDLSGKKTVSKYLSIKADWEQQSGRNCGDEVDDGQTPPQPSGPPWIKKYKLGGKTLDLTYLKYVTRWQQEVENVIDHIC